ncbi:MAG: carboxypeptidase-like regulatory domain-containing protein [Acidobacteriota bacterium]
MFRPSGLALPGAEVELTRAAQNQPDRKFKKMKATSDSRGEFAFRVPPDAADYKVTVRANGYEAQEKPVSVAGEVRMDVFFRLEPASNTERKR